MTTRSIKLISYGVRVHSTHILCGQEDLGVREHTQEYRLTETCLERALDRVLERHRAFLRSQPLEPGEYIVFHAPEVQEDYGNWKKNRLLHYFRA